MRTKLVAVTTLLLVLCGLSGRAGAGEYAGAGSPGVSGASIESVIMPRVAQLRGLSFLAEVPFETKTPEQVREYVQGVFDEDMPEERIRGYEMIMRHMGLLEPGVNLKETIVKAYAGNIAAYYDDREKSFTMVSRTGLPRTLDAMTAAHELTHALQDQYFDLAGLRRFVQNHDDAGLAVMALAEGDASDIMMRYHEGGRGRDGGPVRDYSKFLAINLGPQSIPDLPLVIAQDMVFPYTYGARFLATVLEKKGARAVNAAFRDPPVSTEQIIDPGKYLKRDEPYLIELPDVSDVLPEGWREVDSEPLGQFNLSIFLAVHLGSWGIDEAVNSWAGDVVAGYAGPEAGDFFFVYYSTWDSPAGAAKFFETAGRLVEARFAGASRVCGREGFKTWSENGRLYYLRRRGADVLLIEKVPAPAAGEVVMRLWQARKTPFGVARPIADRDRLQPEEWDYGR